MSSIFHVTSIVYKMARSSSVAYRFLQRSSLINAPTDSQVQKVTLKSIYFAHTAFHLLLPFISYCVSEISLRVQVSSWVIT